MKKEDVITGERSGQVIVRSGEGGKYREVPLNKDAREALKTWLSVRPYSAGDALFVGYRGLPLKTRGAQRMVKRLAIAARLDHKEVTPHTLRHTFGKNLIDAGVSLDRVAMLMGR